MGSMTAAIESTPQAINLASPLYLPDAGSTPYAESGQSDDSPAALPFSGYDLHSPVSSQSARTSESPLSVAPGPYDLGGNLLSPSTFARTSDSPLSVAPGPYDFEGNLLSPSTFAASSLYTRVPLATRMPLHHPIPHSASTRASLRPILGFHPRVLTYSPPKNYVLVVRDLEHEHICAFLGRFGLEVPSDSASITILKTDTSPPLFPPPADLEKLLQPYKEEAQKEEKSRSNLYLGQLEYTHLISSAMGQKRKRTFGKPEETKKQPNRTFSTTLSTACGRGLQKILTAAPPPSLPPFTVVPARTDEGLVEDFPPAFDIALGIHSTTFIDHTSLKLKECPSGITIVKRKRKEYPNSISPITTWKNGYRDAYLDLNMELEGRGRHWGQICNLCQDLGQKVEFRCRDCQGTSGLCQSCARLMHTSAPLHVLEKWNGSYFDKVTTKSLGLRYQLGHVNGERCQFPHPGPKHFVVVHTNGIHRIDISFCGCPNAPLHYEQLMLEEWWPSTPLEPQTVFSNVLLHTFHLLNLQGRLSPTDYYRMLQQYRNGSGLESTDDRLAQFMDVIRQWRHIKMAKRAGRGHDPKGIAGTESGQLSVPCRACPHPNRNLPKGWEDCPPEIKWLYGLILAEDANFKQKARLWSTDGRDPPLGPGWATFVNNEAYLQHLANYVHQDEISHCVGFAALWKANNKRSKGLRATGIGAVSCARHEMFRANGMGDLQKGERYANMDFIFLTSVIGTMLHLITISYDIACQWSINFFNRMAVFPSNMQLPETVSLQFLVPKFHLAAHVSKCFGPFSFNFTPGVGRTDGEGVERNWSWLNGIARCVSMMGMGGRWDTIDDFCNYSNWRKVVSFETSLLRRMSLAIADGVVHHRAFLAFTEGLRSEDPQQLAKWELEVKAWEADRTLPSPYDIPQKDVTFADIKMQLSQSEHSQAEKGDTTIFLAESTPSAFIVAGLELEEAQQCLIIDIKAASTTTQQTAIQRRKTTLLRKMMRYRECQLAYMPSLAHHIPSGGLDLLSSSPETISLRLPSSLPPETRALVCIADVANIEDQLRYAQATDALSELRSQLLKRTLGNKYKAKNEASQRAYTRFRILQDQTEAKVRAAAATYRKARSALFALRGPGDWEKILQVLKPEDVRGMHEKTVKAQELADYRATRRMAGLPEEAEPGETDDLFTIPMVPVHPVLEVGEGSRLLSWIWYGLTKAERDTGQIDGAFRVQWLKSRANAARYKEEIQLLEEEMRRVLEYCLWQARWWEEQVTRRQTENQYLSEGLQAYACQQAEGERARHRHLSKRWAPARAHASLVLTSHLNLHGDTTDVPSVTIELDDEQEADDTVRADDEDDE